MRKILILLSLLLFVFANNSYAGTWSSIRDYFQNYIDLSYKTDAPSELVNGRTWAEEDGIHYYVNSTEEITQESYPNEVIYCETLAEIRAAITTLEAADGGVIKILPNTYDMEGETTIEISGGAPIWIIGLGQHGSGNNSGARFDNPDGIDVFTFGNNATTTDNIGFKIENLLFYGDSPRPATGAGIKIINMSGGIFINNCAFWNMAEGINIQSEGASNYCYGVFTNNGRWDNCEVAYTCETITGGNNNYTNFTVVSDGYFNNNDKAFYFKKAASTGTCAGHKISNCYIDANVGDVMIDSDGARGVQVINSSFDGAEGYEGINLDATSYQWKFINCSIDGDVAYSEDSLLDIQLFPDSFRQYKLTYRGVDNSGHAVDLLRLKSTDANVSNGDAALLKCIHRDDGDENAIFIELKDNNTDTKYKASTTKIEIALPEIDCPDRRTIADNGGGTAATLTLVPTTSFVLLNCEDSNTCDITMSETSATVGQEVNIVNASANVCDFADTSGVTELNGAYAMGQWQHLKLRYVGDRWVEESRSAN